MSLPEDWDPKLVIYNKLHKLFSITKCNQLGKVQLIKKNFYYFKCLNYVVITACSSIITAYSPRNYTAICILLPIITL